MDPYRLPVHLVQHLASKRLREMLAAQHFNTLQDLLCIPSCALFNYHHSIPRATYAEFNALKRSIITDIGQYVALAVERGIADRGSDILRKKRLAPCHILLECLEERIPEALLPTLTRKHALTLQDLLLIGDITVFKNRPQVVKALALCKREFLGPVQQVLLESRDEQDVEDIDVLRSPQHKRMLRSMTLVDSLLHEGQDELRDKLSRSHVASLLDVTDTSLLSDTRSDWTLPSGQEKYEMQAAAKAFITHGRWAHMDFFLHDGHHGLA